MAVKTFVLELLTIKLLESKKGEKLSDQLLHVWGELRDNIQNLTVEDPANPTGNDLSDIFNESVKAQLSYPAAGTLKVSRIRDGRRFSVNSNRMAESASKF